MLKDNSLTDPIEIKIAFIRLGKTQAEVARNLGVSNVIVTNVIKGRRTSKRVKAAIAKALGKRVSELWPNHKKKAA
jgi:DNA-binding XRE family transcriptional regulator